MLGVRKELPAQRFKTKPVDHTEEKGKGNYFLIVLWLLIRTEIKIIRILSVIIFIMECYSLSSHWVCAFALKTEGLHRIQAAERRVAKPYSFGKTFLDEFLSTLNVFHFDNKVLCCALSEDVYNLIPLPVLMSTVTA